MHQYQPVLLSCEMNKYGYWVATWSLRAGLRLPVTVAKVGISRSEAQLLSAGALPAATPEG